MKFIAILILVLACQNLADAQLKGGPFLLEGNIKGKDSGYVYIGYNIANKGVYDSCLLRQGHFVFKGNIPEPVEAHFTAFSMGDERGSSHNSADFYLDATHMKVAVVMDQFKNLQLSGSPADADRIRLLKMQAPIRKEIDSLQDALSKYKEWYNLEKKNGADSFKLTALKIKMDSIYFKQIEPKYREIYHIDSAFIVNNPDSYVAADMLAHTNYKTIAFPSLEKLYNNLPEDIQLSIPGQSILHKVESDKNVAIGNYANNFIAVDNKNDTINLASYKGKKYVLIDFWASWCGPCREVAPSLKKIYAEYNNELEIISIAIQDKEDDWHKAIEKDAMRWPQILESNTVITPADKSISEMYYVNAIPSFFLIDKNSQIIEKYGAGYSAKSIYLLDNDIKTLFRH